MRQIIFFLTALIILNSCEPVNHVKFEKSQPSEVKESSGFRKLIRGVYLNYKTPTKSIRIHKNLITTTRVFQFKADRNKIEISNMAHIDRHNDSSLTAYLNQLGGDVKIINDSVYFSQTVTDTFFMIDSNHILKHYKRSYYLNFRTEDDFWNVYRIKFKGDTLLFGEISPSDTLLSYDFTKVDSITRNQKTKEYVLDPDKKELRKLMRTNVFSFTEKYIKQ